MWQKKKAVLPGTKHLKKKVGALLYTILQGKNRWKERKDSAATQAIIKSCRKKTDRLLHKSIQGFGQNMS